MLTECEDALEADFQHIYRTDLGDLWRGDMTIRKAGAWAAQLPAGSQVWIALDHDAAWTRLDYMTAILVDRGRGKESDPTVPRPSDSRKDNIQTAAAEAKAARFEAKQAARQLNQ